MAILASETNTVNATQRLVFIDGLRGVAAMLVLCYHFYNNSPYWEVFKNSLPEVVVRLLLKGWLGVEIFFVISGYVIVMNLTKEKMSLRYAAGFLVKRFVRLAPPYWIAILVWIVLTWASNQLLSRTLSYPSWYEILSHILYLQNIMGFQDIVPVTWSLCLEMQFYLFCTLCAVLINSRRRWIRSTGILLASGVTTYSLAGIAFGLFSYNYEHYYFPGMWYLFAAGGVVAILHPPAKQFKIAAVVSALIVFALLTMKWRDEALMGGMAVSALMIALYFGKMETWLGGPVIQYVGKRSYSIYLIHFVIGLRVINLGARFFGDSVAAAVGVTGLAVVVTLIGSEIMYRFVEKPSICWAHVAGLLISAKTT